MIEYSSSAPSCHFNRTLFVHPKMGKTTSCPSFLLLVRSLSIGMCYERYAIWEMSKRKKGKRGRVCWVYAITSERLPLPLPLWTHLVFWTPILLGGVE